MDAVKRAAARWAGVWLGLVAVMGFHWGQAVPPRWFQAAVLVSFTAALSLTTVWGWMRGVNRRQDRALLTDPPMDYLAGLHRRVPTTTVVCNCRAGPHPATVRPTLVHLPPGANRDTVQVLQSVAEALAEHQRHRAAYNGGTYTMGKLLGGYAVYQDGQPVRYYGNAEAAGAALRNALLSDYDRLFGAGLGPCLHGRSDCLGHPR